MLCILDRFWIDVTNILVEVLFNAVFFSLCQHKSKSYFHIILLELKYNYRNIWFLSTLVPSKREKNYTNWDNLVCLSLYIFWRQSHLCFILQNTFFCKSKQSWLENLINQYLFTPSFLKILTQTPFCNLRKSTYAYISYLWFMSIEVETIPDPSVLFLEWK